MGVLAQVEMIEHQYRISFLFLPYALIFPTKIDSLLEYANDRGQVAVYTTPVTHNDSHTLRRLSRKCESNRFYLPEYDSHCSAPNHAAPSIFHSTSGG
jgi:hypothetical protein